jgi:hypothetical protein
MAYILTETDDFDADITVPEGSDTASAEVLAAAFQKLANRSKYLRSRAGYVGFWQMDASSLADGSKVTLTTISSNDGFTLSDSLRRITFPVDGWYQADVMGYSQGTVLDSLDFYLAGVNTSNHKIHGIDTPVGGDRAFNGSGLFRVIDLEVDLFDIRGNTNGGGSFSLDATIQNVLVVRKVYP